MSKLFPDFSGNACAACDDADRRLLWEAATIFADSRGLVMRIASVLGEGAEWVGGKAAEAATKLFGDVWQDQVKSATEDALWHAHDWATTGLDAEGGGEPWNWFNKAVATVTGTATGFFGLPGALVDIPITTLLMMRSIAEIARFYGEDLSTDETKRACLQVFAFGGPGTQDDDAEVSYWVTRSGLSHKTIEVLIKRILPVFSVSVSERLMATAVPVAGAAAGGTLNYVFMDFYQDMARVHFTIRSLERRHGEEAGVRACFDSLVRQARMRKRVSSPDDVKDDEGSFTSMVP